MTPREKIDDFEARHGKPPYALHDLAVKRANLQREWWGSNLVLFPPEKNKDGKWEPRYNVYD